MKNRLLLGKIAVLLAVAVVCFTAGGEFLAQQKDDVLYTENPNLTGTLRLSEYNPNLKGTGADVDIYVFDSGVPGGKGLVYGGTHPNEPSAVLSAVTYLENAKCEAGTLYVIVRANNSGFSHTQPLRGQMNKLTFTLADGTAREFRLGTRISNPVHQWPDPNYRLNRSGRELMHDEIAEIRNLNRNHPGVEDGYLTEMACNAIYNFIRTEGIDFIVDGHEAGAESVKLVNYLVVHEKAMPLGSSAVMNCVLNGYPYKMEISGQTSYGLSHRGLGDSTDALCTLFETCNPVMGCYHDKVTERIVKEGISDNYLAMHRAGLFPNSYAYDETGSPIEKRAAYQMVISSEVIRTFSEMYPDKKVVVTGLPDPQVMIEKGLEYTLKPLA